MIDGEGADAVLFENADWRVVGDGLEHRGTGYFIARDGLDRRSHGGLWEWPLHLAEKRWCTPRLFREAFLAAADLFAVARDEALTRSFASGFGLRIGQAGAGAPEGFTRLGEYVRPRSVARKRPVGIEARSVPARSAPHRQDEGDRIHAAL